MALEEATAPLTGRGVEKTPAAVTAPRQAPAAARTRTDETRAALLTAPILATLLKLALPTVTVLVAQTAVNIAEAYYVGFLGTDALAGAALVFPIFMLMTMMSNGGLGSGVASSVARAVGAGRRDDADALLFHAIVLAIIFGGLFTLGATLGGPALYRLLGGRGDALDAAVQYSNFLFAGAIPVWIVNLQAAALRGSGNVRVPALVTLVGAIVTIPASPILGLFNDILKVGVPTAVNAALTNLTVILVTGAVGLFGTSALAGYGISSRLDYIMIPLLFGISTATLTMVGVNMGAGQTARARKIGWTSAIVGLVFTGTIGLFVAVFPTAWLHLFSKDADVVREGTTYLRIVAPAYSALGFGFVASFATQGTGRAMGPLAASFARILIAAGGGWIAVASFGAGMPGLAAMVTASLSAYAAICAVIMLSPALWRPEPR
jgi:Na+-driven multidrug efflux pump